MAWNAKGKVTRREGFLAEMDAVIPWVLLGADRGALSEGRQRPPVAGVGEDAADLLPAAWFILSDPQAEDWIYDSESMRRFARVELGDDVVPARRPSCAFVIQVAYPAISLGAIDPCSRPLRDCGW
jgi:hypothetical protein